MRFSPGRKELTAEGIVKRDVKHLLKTCGWFVFHIQQGAYSFPGISDLIAIKNCIVLFIELKSAKGKQSNDQKKFQADIEAQGGTYLLIDNPSDLLKYLKGIGDTTALRMWEQ